MTCNANDSLPHITGHYLYFLISDESTTRLQARRSKAIPHPTLGLVGLWLQITSALGKYNMIQCSSTQAILCCSFYLSSGSLNIFTSLHVYILSTKRNAMFSFAFSGVKNY